MGGRAQSKWLGMLEIRSWLNIYIRWHYHLSIGESSPTKLAIKYALHTLQLNDAGILWFRKDSVPHLQ